MQSFCLRFSLNRFKIDVWCLLVVTQFYDTDVNKAYVIRGNSVVMKCETPSYVTDFLTVVSWHTDNGDIYYPGENNGSHLDGVKL